VFRLNTGCILALLRVLSLPSLWPTVRDFRLPPAAYLQSDFRQLSKNPFAALLPFSVGQIFFFLGNIFKFNKGS